MATINPYLTFNGNCEDAFNFYKSVFETDFHFLEKFKNMPKSENPISENDLNKIMHVSLPIGGETILMGSDTIENGPKVNSGTNFSISINAKSKEEADKLFNGLSSEGNTIMPLSDTFWGAYFGMFVDKFGIQWMVNFDKQQPTAN